MLDLLHKKCKLGGYVRGQMPKNANIICEGSLRIFKNFNIRLLFWYLARSRMLSSIRPLALAERRNAALVIHQKYGNVFTQIMMFPIKKVNDLKAREREKRKKEPQIILCLATLELWLPDNNSFVVFLLRQKTNLALF